MVEVLQHIGLVFFYVFLFILNVSIFLGVPGSWIALGAILIYDLATGFSTVGWVVILVMVGIVVLGEIVEAFLGIVYVAHKGATRWGVLGAFIGGLAGGIGGSFVVPFLGSIVLGIAGAFAGAVAFEYLYYRSLDRALQTGFFAFIGKLGAMMVKFAMGLVIIGLFIYRSWS
ncbi:MAG: DUF456 domain-containing protein [Candidatus Krumholzibacteria bacterium]|nr:DUF456 domain-containing protein [Candidatus Krumholzibacteria bacterium]